MIFILRSSTSFHKSSIDEYQGYALEIGISGSPIKNSNTDRLVKVFLESSGIESEFVKLSRIKVRPASPASDAKAHDDVIPSQKRRIEQKKRDRTNELFSEGHGTWPGSMPVQQALIVISRLETLKSRHLPHNSS